MPVEKCKEIQSRKPRQRKLRLPKSAAAVITLQPAAENRGITYAKELAEAKEKVDPQSFGINELRFKKVASGGRMLEVPEVSSEKIAAT